MRLFITIPLITTLLAGCSMIPDYSRPDVETPKSWSAQETESSINETTQWWTNFKSDELNGLIGDALANNTDIKAGVQRIKQARASLKIAGASTLPTVGATAGASRSKTNAAQGNDSYSSSLNVGVNISYDLDLFGANAADIATTEAEYDNVALTQGALALSIMGDVANGYFTLSNLRQRLSIAEDNLTNAREVLRIVQARVDQGAESELELSQQRSAVATREATKATLIEQITNTENALAILTGRPPQSLDLKRRNLNSLSIPQIAAGQPSELLERRPDLLAAEASLITANANIGAAKAAFYPSVSLGLNNGLSWAGLGEPSTSVLSLVSSLSAPIFQGGRLEGGMEQATARQVELMENYRGSVLTAFQEVEDALAAVKSAETREKSLRTAMEQSRKAYQISKARYDAGSIDFQTLLDTQTSLLSAEDTYAQSRLARLNAAVTLYRALGGGWKA